MICRLGTKNYLTQTADMLPLIAAINQTLRDSALDPPELLQPVTKNSSGSAVGYGSIAYGMCTMSVLPTRVHAAIRVWFRTR